jgi:uncharacterized membrane protein YhaH (DUF805 family)
MNKTNIFSTDYFFKSYANLSGRSTRTDFWLFQLAVIIVSTVLSVFIYFSEKLGIISFLFSLFIFIPSLAISVRRLHDIGKSGYWMLPGIIATFTWVILVPLLILLAVFSSFANCLGLSILLVMTALIYNIVLLVFFVTPSEKVENKYGKPAQL